LRGKKLLDGGVPPLKEAEGGGTDERGGLPFNSMHVKIKATFRGEGKKGEMRRERGESREDC